MCQLHAVSLNRYLMQLTDDFKRERRDEDARWKYAAECQGRNDGDIWVLNEEVQIDQYGNLLAAWSTKYVWLGRLIARESVVPHKLASEIATPLGAMGLSSILTSLKKCSGTYSVSSHILGFFKPIFPRPWLRGWGKGDWSPTHCDIETNKKGGKLWKIDKRQGLIKPVSRTFKVASSSRNLVVIMSFYFSRQLPHRKRSKKCDAKIF